MNYKCYWLKSPKTNNVFFCGKKRTNHGAVKRKYPLVAKRGNCKDEYLKDENSTMNLSFC